MKLSKDEQETHIYQNAANRSEWIIYTDDPMRIREYRKKKFEEIKTVGVGVEFKLPDSQMTLRKKAKISIKEFKRRNTMSKTLSTKNTQ